MKSLSSADLDLRLLTNATASRLPHTVIFELTYGCNLKCVHCCNPTHKALPDELTTEEVFAILRQLADLGVLTLCMTGGELFTRPDLFSILQEAHRLGFLLEIISNATRLTPDLAKRLTTFRLHHICFSIYGATPDTYERVTGQSGSYDLFLQGLALAAEYRLPVAAVRMPVLTVNAHEVAQARALVERMGFKFQYCTEVFPRTDGHAGPLAVRLSPQESVNVTRLFASAADHSPTDSACTGRDRFIDCACGQNRFAITPYGDMNLCTAFPIPRYDLRKGSVKEGWEILKATVDQAHTTRRDDCPSCTVRPACQQKRNHAWLEAGDLSVCLPHYHEWAVLETSARDLINPRPLH